ncbi:MAG TPA: type IV pilin [Candidatus Thermoplasmatota archaeon]|jgi:FlaG/FlaF family flagellin (archaellin)|nr:type IV pilin [Candidatus Thermoplasmatota archaeon]
MRANASARARHDAAAADIIGSILVVGITTAIMGGIALMIVSLPGPTPRQHSDLALTLDRGGSAWGSGNERVLLSHLGGDPFETGSTVITVAVNGALTTYEGGSLGGPFSDGVFKIQEEWSATQSIAASAVVEVSISGPGGLVFMDTITAGAS